MNINCDIIKINDGQGGTILGIKTEDQFHILSELDLSDLEKNNECNIMDDIHLKNQAIMIAIKEKVDQLSEIKNRKIYANISTYGCQMNEHDSEKLRAMLKKMGYVMTDSQKKADIAIINTCCVRENAELKVYGNLGHLKPQKRKNPDMLIVVCGCMMQQKHIVETIKNKYRHVDLVFGTHNIHEFPSMIYKASKQKNMLVDVWDKEGDIIEGMEADRKFGLKAFVNIMYGCNNFCSFCIVPYTRGRERSRTPQAIIDEITELARGGVKEITLLGQNVNSYGNTFSSDNKVDFSDLIRMVNEVEGIERIRFMTSHPKDISDRLIDAITECKHVCEHVHLPVQSGSDNLLRKMNRRYTVSHYLNTIEKLRAKMPDVTISTDLITGFPGETEEDFLETMKLIEKVRYDSAFTFLYSIREGTPAAKMNDQIPDAIKHHRFDRLLNRINEIISEKNMCMKDKVFEVLVEGSSSKTNGTLMGRTRGYHAVNFKGDSSLVGQLVKVKITQPKRHSLIGEIVNG